MAKPSDDPRAPRANESALPISNVQLPNQVDVSYPLTIENRQSAIGEVSGFELQTIRILRDPPLDGPTNMARDEALLIHVGEGRSPPTLRFYDWNPPTISLGYFQPFKDFEELEPPEQRLAVVRRITGGGAILHDRELTYSLTLPIDHPLLVGGPNQLYERFHDAVIAALGEWRVDTWRGAPSDDSGAAKGPFFCFERRHRFDVLLGSAKIAGSAQRRTRTAVLQHGSILLSDLLARGPGHSSPTVDRQFSERLCRQITSHFAASAGLFASAGEWMTHEYTVAECLFHKYSGNDWTHRT